MCGVYRMSMYNINSCLLGRKAYVLSLDGRRDRFYIGLQLWQVVLAAAVAVLGTPRYVCTSDRVSFE